MESSDPDDEPFHLAPGTCWVLCDNEDLSPKVPVWTFGTSQCPMIGTESLLIAYYCTSLFQEAIDSRSFGPLLLRNITGRAIYHSRSAVEHGFVENR